MTGQDENKAYQNDTARPDIHRGSNVFPIGNDQFWCGITRTSTTGHQEILSITLTKLIRKSKIGNN